MTVAEASRIARDRIMQTAGAIPGFYGALFHGSINEMRKDDLFPENSDADILIITEGRIPETPGKFIQDGLILDVSYMGRDQLGSAQEILGQYHLAGSFRYSGIIADVSGDLTRIQQEVSKDFAKRYWVRKRCRNAADRVLRYLQQSDESAMLPPAVTNWLFAKGVLTHILLVAGLRNPTVRKRYAAVQKLLAEYKLPDFYEILLNSLGCADTERSRVEDRLQSLIRIFDTAKLLRKTAQPFSGDISDTARTISIAGSRQLIESGYHREAVFWILATYSRCMHILSVDAPEIYQTNLAGYYEVLQDLKIFSTEDLKSGNAETRKLLPRVLQMAEIIMQQNPEIRD